MCTAHKEKVKPVNYFVTVVAVVLSLGRVAAAQGGTSHFAPSDTSSIDLSWFTNNVGGDLFVSGEFYGLHLSGPAGTGSGIGPGVELRFRPVLLGYIGVHPEKWTRS